MAELLSELFSEIEAAVKRQPTQYELRSLRDRCDSQATRRATREAFRAINDPDVRDEILDHHRRMIRALEEKIASLEEGNSQAKAIGIGLGAGVAGSGIIAAISIAAPPLALIPIAGGAYCLWRGSENAKTLAAEQTLYEQLKDAADRLLPHDD